MKKIIVFVMFMAMLALAAENCYVSADPGNPKVCDETGYICWLGVDINPMQNAVFFYLGQDAACTESLFFKSTAFPTTLRQNVIVNGKTVLQSVLSPYTKFFIVNDGTVADPLSMTVSGSFALSAYNRSEKVHVVYRMANPKDDTEWGGVRVTTLLFQK